MTAGLEGVRKAQDTPKGYEKWLIERNSKIGKKPDAIKNHPWNLKSVERSVHQRIHGNDPGGETFNFIEKLWYGSPTWAKGAAGSVGVGIGTDSIVGEE